MLQRIVRLLKLDCKLCGQTTCFSTKARLFNKITVCVEGNIGSGKTTFLKHFQKYDNLIETNEEPVEQWRDFGGENPLASLYSDPARWAYTFQSLVLLTLMKRHTQPQTKPVRMLERSIYSARHCFVENLKRSHVLSDIEYKMLSQWFNYVIDSSDFNVDLIVYLRTSPEVCYERIKARNRPEEQIVSLEYLRQLHNLHEDWLCNSEKLSVIQTPVLVVNGDNDIKTMKKKFYNIHEQLLSRLKQPVYS